MPNKAPAQPSGIIQATILKKCDRDNHRPGKRKDCAARDRGEHQGACQHTCDHTETPKCRHAWTVRYWAHDVQREASFKTLTEAEVFQADLSTKKVTQGALFTDPRAGAVKFREIRKQYTARQDVSAGTLADYESNYRGSGAAAMLDNLPAAAVARMDAEVEELFNVTLLARSRTYRATVLRMITGTLNLAVQQAKLPGHRLVAIELKTYRPTAEEYAARNASWVFLTDAQAAMMADGITAEPTPANGRKRRRQLTGVGVAVWLMRCCGARIGEALGAEKADFTSARTGAACGSCAGRRTTTAASGWRSSTGRPGKAGTSRCPTWCGT